MEHLKTPGQGIFIEKQKVLDILQSRALKGYDAVLASPCADFAENMLFLASEEIEKLPTQSNQSRERETEEVKSFGHDNHLENCPFCNGSEKDNVVMLGYKYPKYRITCDACGYFIEDDRKDKVFFHWSIRAEREELEIVNRDLVGCLTTMIEAWSWISDCNLRFKYRDALSKSETILKSIQK